jgi:hypothetical protein
MKYAIATIMLLAIVIGGFSKADRHNGVFGKTYYNHKQQSGVWVVFRCMTYPVPPCSTCSGSLGDYAIWNLPNGIYAVVGHYSGESSPTYYAPQHGEDHVKLDIYIGPIK